MKFKKKEFLQLMHQLTNNVQQIFPHRLQNVCWLLIRLGSYACTVSVTVTTTVFTIHVQTCELRKNYLYLCAAFIYVIVLFMCVCLFWFLVHRVLHKNMLHRMVLLWLIHILSPISHLFYFFNKPLKCLVFVCN